MRKAFAARQADGRQRGLVGRSIVVAAIAGIHLGIQDRIKTSLLLGYR
jgi:hypothetical protein